MFNAPVKSHKACLEGFYYLELYLKRVENVRDSLYIH